MSRIIVAVVCLLLACQLMAVSGAPQPEWFNQLFGASSSRPYYGRQGQQRAVSGNRQPRDRYKSICRVINVDNYAFPGKVPYPSAPFCPYGD